MDKINLIYPLALVCLMLTITIWRVNYTNYQFQKKLVETLSALKNHEGNHLVPVKALKKELDGYILQLVFSVGLPGSMLLVILYQILFS